MLRCGRMANGIFKASLEWVGRRRGCLRWAWVQFLFEGLGGRGELSQLGINNHIASENSIQFHSPVLPKIITQRK